MRDEPTCEGYAPQKPAIRKGDKVRLKETTFHAVRGRFISAGTLGEVLAVRDAGAPPTTPEAILHFAEGSGAEVLVKFQGFSWPKAVSPSLVEKVTLETPCNCQACQSGDGH